MLTTPFWIACGIALFNCFVAANNVALHHYSVKRLEELLIKKSLIDRLVYFSTNRRKLLFMTAVTRAVSNLVILMCMMIAFDPLQEDHYWIGLGAAFASAGLLIVVLGVGAPASWGRYAADALLMYSYNYFRLGMLLFTPILMITKWIDPIVRRLVGVSEKDWEELTSIEQDILDAVIEGEKSGLVDEDQADMIEAIVEFSNTTADQIMTPRTDIDGIPVDSNLDETRELISKIGHSRVPVYEGDLDHIIGILYVKDLLNLLGSNNSSEFSLREMARDTWFVPETVLLKDLLLEFRRRKVHMALVLDEYGGTAGLITVEDIIEEIVGEIQDEYEPHEIEPHIERIDERNIYVDGRLYIDDLNDELNAGIPEDEDYDTVAGFAFANFGHVPKEGESFVYNQMTVTVIEAEKTRINKMQIMFDHDLPEPSSEQSQTEDLNPA